MSVLICEVTKENLSLSFLQEKLSESYENYDSVVEETEVYKVYFTQVIDGVEDYINNFIRDNLISSLTIYLDFHFENTFQKYLIDNNFVFEKYNYNSYSKLLSLEFNTPVSRINLLTCILNYTDNPTYTKELIQPAISLVPVTVTSLSLVYKKVLVCIVPSTCFGLYLNFDFTGNLKCRLSNLTISSLSNEVTITTDTYIPFPINTLVGHKIEIQVKGSCTLNMVYAYRVTS